jgi:hypothetical protein
MPVDKYDETKHGVLPPGTRVFFRDTQVGPAWDVGEIVKHLPPTHRAYTQVALGNLMQAGGNTLVTQAAALSATHVRLRTPQGQVVGYKICCKTAAPKTVHYLLSPYGNANEELAFEVHGYLRKIGTGALDTAIVDSLTFSAGLSLLLDQYLSGDTKAHADFACAILGVVFGIAGGLFGVKQFYRGQTESEYLPLRTTGSLRTQGVLNFISAITSISANVSAACGLSDAVWVKILGAVSPGAWTLAQAIDFINAVVTIGSWCLEKHRGQDPSASLAPAVALAAKTVFTLLGGSAMAYATAMGTAIGPAAVFIGIIATVVGSAGGGIAVHVTKKKSKVD